jgi:hypothetical protein
LSNGEFHARAMSIHYVCVGNLADNTRMGLL